MRAIFIAVGSEMLERNYVDTNSIYVAQKLMEKGILVDMKIIVGDDLENLGWIIKQACKRAQLVIITGGLGPTEDDLTREATANALNRELIYKEDIVEHLKMKFKKRGVKMPDINARQAFVLKGAQLLENPIGTAPGQILAEENFLLVLLPGPPHEMKAIFEQVLEDRIAPLCNFFTYTRSFKFGGITESEVDSRISEYYTKYKNPRTTILSTPGLIEVHLLGRSRKSPEEAQIVTDELAEKIKEKMNSYLITEKDISIEEYLVEELKAKNLTLSVAESCTGGDLGNRITNVPGCSQVFLGGVIAYANEIKKELLKVEEKVLLKHGAVSAAVAKEMAAGVKKLTGSDIGIAITGIAGPGGATKGKPVGLVYIHLCANDREMGIYKISPGHRQLVKTRTVNYALNLLKRYLSGQNGL